MGQGEWVESAIVGALRGVIALSLVPLVLLYAALACVVYPIALVVAALKPADSRAALARVPA